MQIDEHDDHEVLGTHSFSDSDVTRIWSLACAVIAGRSLEMHGDLDPEVMLFSGYLSEEMIRILPRVAAQYVQVMKSLPARRDTVFPDRANPGQDFRLRLAPGGGVWQLTIERVPRDTPRT